MAFLRWRRRYASSQQDVELDDLHNLAPTEANESTQDKQQTKSKWRSLLDPSREPSVLYARTPEFRHRDHLGRIHIGPQRDMYLSPVDGSLVPLVVQASQEILDSGGNTWKRTPVGTGNTFMRFATLPFVRYQYAPAESFLRTWLSTATWWLCSSVLLFLMMPWSSLHGKRENDGRYDPFLYKYWGYLKVSPNPQDKRPTEITQASTPDSWRPFLPRFLCCLRQPESRLMEGLRITRINDVIASGVDHKDVAYAYITYTGTQFDGADDYRALHLLGERATRDAGLPAYFIAISCMPEAELLEQTVYTLDSTCRNAKIMVVALGNTIDKRTPTSKLELIRNFGSRLWCRPYLINSPKDALIKIYFRGEAAESHLSLTKTEFALLAWSGEEVELALRLVDHYEGRLQLGPVEHFVLCSRFLFGGYTTQYLPGDYYYVLMGVLQHRPAVEKTDNTWQAFCRICLANETDRLLERLICQLSSQRYRVWATAEDVWKVNLWDIEPTCQVAGVETDGALVVGGAFAASIQWEDFSNVDYIRFPSIRRTVVTTLLRTNIFLLIFGLILRLAGPYQAVIPGTVILLLATLVAILSPILIRHFCSFDSKIVATQPRFFGMEGYVPLETIAQHLFGDISEPPRLCWSPNSSALSSNFETEFSECEGVDPTTSTSHVAMLASMSKDSQVGEPRLFTLVDTGSMAVTLFMARQPPVCILCCGQEGGMQRALLCSYDWTTSTLYRQTIVRLESTVVNHMRRLGRVKLMLYSEKPVPIPYPPATPTQDIPVADVDSATSGYRYA